MQEYKPPFWFQISVQCLIIYSIITTFLETVPELKTYATFFHMSEIIVVVIFTLEYLFLWFKSKNKRAYPFGFMASIDLLAIAPFYIGAAVDLRGIRIFRLLRITRLMKLGRYSRAINTLGEAFRRSAPELIVFGIVAMMTLTISAMAIYYAEHEAQPDVFSSLPASLWWAIVTLTTVGYGDVYPITAVGKIIAAAVMLIGIGVIAIPTAIISSNFTDLIKNERA
ncbi:ion transporter [Pirellulaceae bacterium]|nr:ion transporter [Pirellulaceae bacterium]